MSRLSRRSLLKHATLTGMALPLASVARLGWAAANVNCGLPTSVSVGWAGPTSRRSHHT